jgi:hypothetical protein
MTIAFYKHPFSPICRKRRRPASRYGGRARPTAGLGGTRTFVRASRAFCLGLRPAGDDTGGLIESTAWSEQTPSSRIRDLGATGISPFGGTCSAKVPTASRGDLYEYPHQVEDRRHRRAALVTP